MKKLFDYLQKEKGAEVVCTLAESNNSEFGITIPISKKQNALIIGNYGTVCITIIDKKNEHRTNYECYYDCDELLDILQGKEFVKTIKKLKWNIIHKSGVYATIYGNACAYESGEDVAYDLDMAEDIPLEAVDFSEYIRDLD